MYKLTNSTSILRTADNASIPDDPANADYSQYLLWLAAGNIPDSADPVLPTVPTVISMVQARQALLAADLLTTVEQGMAVMPKATQIDWQFRQTVERHSPLVNTFAIALNLDSDTLDSLFISASKL